MGNKNLYQEQLKITATFPGGRISTIPGHDKYRKVRDIFENYSTGLEIFGVSPIFFEMYKGKNDSGFVVDVKKREIRIFEKRYEKLCENAILECNKNGLEFKLVK